MWETWGFAQRFYWSFTESRQICTHSRWRRRNHEPPKCRDLLIRRHSVTFWKSWFLVIILNRNRHCTLNADRLQCDGCAVRYTEATDGVPWAEGLTPLDASHFLPSVVFIYRPLWPVSAKPKGLLLAKVITWLSLPRSMGIGEGKGDGVVYCAGGGGKMASRRTCFRGVSIAKVSETELDKGSRGWKHFKIFFFFLRKRK
jgi:hypothetical protein